MAGTVKFPEPVLVGEVVGCGELFGCAEAVAVTDGSAAAERLCVGEVVGVRDDPGVPVSADVGDAPGAPSEADANPLAAAADATPGGVDPVAPHAVRPAPPMTAAMITAETRHIPMLLTSDK
jgi:hypothetical protein